MNRSTNYTGDGFIKNVDISTFFAILCMCIMKLFSRLVISALLLEKKPQSSYGGHDRDTGIRYVVRAPNNVKLRINHLNKNVLEFGLIEGNVCYALLG